MEDQEQEEVEVLEEVEQVVTGLLEQEPPERPSFDQIDYGGPILDPHDRDTKLYLLLAVHNRNRRGLTDPIKRWIDKFGIVAVAEALDELADEGYLEKGQFVAIYQLTQMGREFLLDFEPKVAEQEEPPEPPGFDQIDYGPEPAKPKLVTRGTTVRGVRFGDDPDAFVIPGFTRWNARRRDYAVRGGPGVSYNVAWSPSALVVLNQAGFDHLVQASMITSEEARDEEPTTKEKVTEYLRRNPGAATARSIAHQLNLSLGSVAGVLAGLTKDGKTRRVKIRSSAERLAAPGKKRRKFVTAYKWVSLL